MQGSINSGASLALRMTGVAVVAGFLCGMPASAALSQFPTNWSFEADAPGTEYVDENGQGPDGWGGDASTAPGAMAVVTEESYSHQYSGPFPLPGQTHTKVLACEGSISNIFETYPVKTLFTNVTVDLMIKAGYYNIPPALDTNPQLAAYVNTAGHLVVKHAYYLDADEEPGATKWLVKVTWTELDHDPIPLGDWARLTLTMDYLSSGSFEDVEHFYTVALNGGAPITNAVAYVSPMLTGGPLGDDPTFDRGGSWFMTADAGGDNPEGGARNKWFTSIELQGAGSIDDLVVSATGSRDGDLPTAFDDWYDSWPLTEGRDGDDDNDGASNWEEYLAGTIPVNSASVFRVIAQMMLDGTNWITFMDGTNSPVTTAFRMYRSTNLLGTWEMVDGSIPRSTTGNNLWPDGSPPAGPAFYQPRLPDSD